MAITAVVVGVLLASGGLQFFFSVQESEVALARVQHEKAVNAALSIAKGAHRGSGASDGEGKSGYRVQREGEGRGVASLSSVSCAAPPP